MALNNIQLISSRFGFGEYYEWKNVPNFEHDKFGYFIEFDKDNPGKILKASNSDNIIGVSSYSTSCVSDDPEEYHDKYIKDEVGKIVYEKNTVAKGEKIYDDLLGMDIIKTFKDEMVYVQLSKNFDPNKEYVQRSFRKEWQLVTLLGKCIVRDNGECIPGDFCTLYNGKDPVKIGIAIPANKKDNIKYYVIERISDKSILILFK